MTPGKILVGQGCLVVSIVAGGLWASTQWAATMLGNQPRLGEPLIMLVGYPIYHPWRLFEWWFAYEAYAPAVFRKAGMLAAGSGLAGTAVAIAGSLWRARQNQMVTTYGSARWANPEELRRSNLLAGKGVFLGRLAKDYLRHDGPEHVLAFAPTRSGILVKPIAADLKTNLVVTTDRRTYHLELESTDGTYMSALSWTYPEDELFAISKRNEDAIGTSSIPVDAGVSFENLNFRYRIEGRASWKPLRAFDDGSKVYIQFGDSLPKGEAPPLFVASSKGEPALVNYRVKNNTYIVDRLFAVAELRLGRDPQAIVRIVRTDAVQPKPRFNFLSDRSRR